MITKHPSLIGTLMGILILLPVKRRGCIHQGSKLGLRIYWKFLENMLLFSVIYNPNNQVRLQFLPGVQV